MPTSYLSSGVFALLSLLVLLVVTETDGRGSGVEDSSSDGGAEDQLGDVRVARVNRAIKALLDLNDGELGTLLSGISVPEAATRLSPSAHLLLSSSQHKFDNIRKELRENRLHNLPGDLRIAKRRRLRAHRPPSTTHSSVDSVLSTMTDLAQYLNAQQSHSSTNTNRNARRTMKHGRRVKKNKGYDSLKDKSQVETNDEDYEYIFGIENFHPEFFFRPESKYNILIYYYYSLISTIIHLRFKSPVVRTIKEKRFAPSSLEWN